MAAKKTNGKSADSENKTVKKAPAKKVESEVKAKKPVDKAMESIVCEEVAKVTGSKYRARRFCSRRRRRLRS